jgi:hypothetical protein
MEYLSQLGELLRGWWLDIITVLLLTILGVGFAFSPKAGEKFAWWLIEPVVDLFRFLWRLVPVTKEKGKK